MEVKPINCFPGGSEPLSHPTANAYSAQLNTNQQRETSDRHEMKGMSEQSWHPPVDVSHLKEEEQKIVRDMLYEESDVFAGGVLTLVASQTCSCKSS